jgi:hypothetical protein
MCVRACVFVCVSVCVFACVSVCVSVSAEQTVKRKEGPAREPMSNVEAGKRGLGTLKRRVP